jgi:hypothetical protein
MPALSIAGATVLHRIRLAHISLRQLGRTGAGPLPPLDRSPILPATLALATAIA